MQSAPEPTPPAPPVQPTNNDALLASLQQRLNTAEGRLAAEVTARQTAERERDALRQAPPPTPAPPQAAPISEEENRDFGKDTVDFITKIARHYADQAAASLGQRIAALEGRLNQTSQQVQYVARAEQATVAERYYAAVTSAVPDFEDVNKDPEFIEWLQNPEKASNKPYIELLTAAHEQGNAGPVIHIFNLFKQEKGLSPAPQPQPTPSSQPTGHIDPASLAAPSTAAPTPPPSGNAPQGKIWTMAEVDQLYADYQNKRISKADFAAREKDYLQALADGRVQ